MKYVRRWISVNHKEQSVKGFTLIELMIVIAVVAILVALAVPAYQDYIIRAKVTECVAAAAPVKTGISEFKYTMGRWPDNENEAGLLVDSSSNVSEFCSYFLYNDGKGDYGVEVDVSEINENLGRIFKIMSPEETSSGSIDWNCTRSWLVTASTAKYLPSSCRDIHTI
jgi:type IV pilus assembly protein PilA